MTFFLSFPPKLPVDLVSESSWRILPSFPMIYASDGSPYSDFGSLMVTRPENQIDIFPNRSCHFIYAIVFFGKLCFAAFAVYIRNTCLASDRERDITGFPRPISKFDSERTYSRQNPSVQPRRSLKL